MPSIDVIIETTPVYITVTPQTNPNIQVKFGAVDSVNGETGNVLINAVPNGGTTGQVLAKNSNTDNDTEWINVSSGGGGIQSVTGTTNRISIDNTDPANPIANIAAAYDTAVTNAIAAAVSGKEDVANKQTDLTPSATKYPTVNAVNAGLTAKKVYVSLIHTVGFNSVNPADANYYYFGAIGFPASNTIGDTQTNLREYGCPATGVIKQAVISIRLTNGGSVSTENSTLSIRNTTKATLSTITSTFNYNTGNNAIINKVVVVTGLNIAVTAGDELMSIIGAPTWATNPLTVIWTVQYLIELP